MNTKDDPKSYKPNFFAFKQFDDEQYLLTNYLGEYQFLSAADFERLRDRPQELPDEVVEELRAKGFLDATELHDRHAEAYRDKNAFLGPGPSLHIVVLTLRCDHKCVYCQASRKSMDVTDCDMDNSTAERTVDLILQTTARSVCIEFQGGEPLANWPVLQHLVEYATARNVDKDLIFSIVTNLRFMDDEKLRYLLDNNVAICTSLDGPPDVHNRARVSREVNSFEVTVDWIKRIQEENAKLDAEKRKFNRVNALLTVTKEVLPQHEELVDLYVELGLPSIHLRPLNPFGYARRLTEKIAYSPDDFLSFYQRVLDYILALNAQGTTFFEKTAQIFLKKILKKSDANYLDLRSPCGAGIGQVAYNYDGRVFPCDEARMISETGDETFLLGEVGRSVYTDIVEHETVRQLCVASCLEGLTGCHDCVYNPYCGACPLYNYVMQGSLFGQMPTNERCKVYMGIQDLLFARLEEHRATFETWVDAV